MITGGFGMLITEGVARWWYIDPDGVKRFEDTDDPVEMAHNPSRGPLGHPHGKPQR